MQSKAGSRLRVQAHGWLRSVQSTIFAAEILEIL